MKELKPIIKFENIFLDDWNNICKMDNPDQIQKEVARLNKALKKVKKK